MIDRQVSDIASGWETAGGFFEIRVPGNAEAIMGIEISGETRLGGLLGSPVAHSLSPAMHNMCFREMNIDFVYLAFDVPQPQIRETVHVLRNVNTYGFNLTMPDKVAVMECLDDCSRAAEMIGAVNTVVNEDGRLIGHNTDGIGYVESARHQGFEPSGKEITLLGAGGAALAAAVQLALDGAEKLHISNRRSRSWNAAREMVDKINRETSCRADLTDLEDAGELAKRIGSSDLLVNATSVGMAPHEDESPLKDVSLLRPELVVSDIIYHPRQTLLLRSASERGCRTFNGMDMLLYQGAAAFRLWTGREMPVERVRRAVFAKQ